jgi:predicted transcriptional regulator
MTKGFVILDSMPIKHRRPTEGELAILQVLWDHGPLSVRDIQRLMDAVKPTGYTTVLKLLQIMHTKDLVERDDTVRPQLYAPRQTREGTQRQLVGDLVDRAFGGSVRTLVLQALATKKSTPEELRAIEKLLDRYERQGRDT